MSQRFEVIISERAGEMLVRHVRFLAQVSPQAGDRFRQDIVTSIESLHYFPERGSWLSDPLLPANKYRKLQVSKRYLVVYQIKDSTVFIEYVIDCRQDYSWLL